MFMSPDHTLYEVGNGPQRQTRCGEGVVRGCVYCVIGEGVYCVIGEGVYCVIGEDVC